MRLKIIFFYLRKRWQPDLKRVLLQPMGTFNRLKLIDIGGYASNTENELLEYMKSKDFVDFAYMNVTQYTDKLDAYFQLLDESGTGDILMEEKVNILQCASDIEPKLDEHCFFAGLILPRLEKHSKQPVFSHILQKTEMVFTGTLEENPIYYRFKVLKPMQSHSCYKGCSGSPILNANGEIIALVNCGCIEENEVYGISIKTCQKFLDLDRMLVQQN